MPNKRNSDVPHRLPELTGPPLEGPIPPDPAAAGLPSVRKHRTLEELAYQDIRQSIAAGRFPPGARIVVRTLAAASGISKIPIMQALRRLETEGFVRINPHKDIVVTNPSPLEYRERYLLLGTLGGLCAREGAAKITRPVLKQLRALQGQIIAARDAGDATRAIAADLKFHQFLWNLGALSKTLQILQNAWDQGEYYRMIVNVRLGGFAKQALEEHEDLLRALEARAFTRAATILERHHLSSLKRLDETLRTLTR